MHLIDNLEIPIVFAHRGDSKHAPENTLAAFDLALSVGAPAIELDTMLTRDGIPVVIHDRTVDRTTDGRGNIDELLLEDIQKLDAGSHFSSEFNEERIPTLEQVFTRYRGKLLINVEMKNYHAPLDALPQVVIDLVRSLHNQDEVIFSSFNPFNLTRIRRLLPEARLALLVDHSFMGRTLASRAFSFISPDYIHPHTSYINAEYVAMEHSHNRRVNVWTTNEPQMVRNFIHWGVDGLIGDDPQELLRISHESH